MKFEEGDIAIPISTHGTKDVNGYLFVGVQRNGNLRMVDKVNGDKIQLDGDRTIWFYAKDFLTPEEAMLENETRKIKKEIG